MTIASGYSKEHKIIFVNGWIWENIKDSIRNERVCKKRDRMPVKLKHHDSI